MARPRRRIGNVPAEATSFVGRRRELAEIGRRWPTLAWSASSAPGASARPAWLFGGPNLGRGFAGGAWWVELAEVREAALVTNAVVAALDLRGNPFTNLDAIHRIGAVYSRGRLIAG